MEDSLTDRALTSILLQRELDHSSRGSSGDRAHPWPDPGARAGGSRSDDRGRAVSGNGNGEPHADGAVSWDVADEVARAGARERDVGRAAAVVAQRAAAGAGEVVVLPHLRHRVLRARVAEHCNRFLTTCQCMRGSTLQTGLREQRDDHVLTQFVSHLERLASDPGDVVDADRPALVVADDERRGRGQRARGEQYCCDTSQSVGHGDLQPCDVLRQ